jgi:hypothetical protein
VDSRQAPRLLIDSKGDGVFDELPVPLKRAQIPPREANSVVQERWTGTATIDVGYSPSTPGIKGDERVSLHLDLSLDLRLSRRGNKARPDAGVQVSLSSRGEWGRRGLIRLGNQDYPALLFDELGGGDYRGSLGGNDSGVRLLIDLDRSGAFERGEAFDVSKPFVALQRTYEIRDLEASGASFRLLEVDPHTPAARGEGEAPPVKP